MTPEESQDTDVWRRAFTIRIDSLEKKLDENTVATERVDRNTTELVDILQSWKGAMKVMEFLSKLVKPVGAIVGVLAAWAAWRSGK